MTIGIKQNELRIGAIVMTFARRPLALWPLLLLAACGGHKAPENGGPAASSAEQKVVNLFIWSEYISPDALASFTKQTGIKVNVSYFDSSEMLEGRMLTGHSGFDVVVPPANFIHREIRSGAYRELDPSQLPNLAHLDPNLMSRVALSDPGNAHSVIYDWGTLGIAYNRRQTALSAPGVALRSWRAVFDVETAQRLAQCGIGMVDSPVEVIRLMLMYLGKPIETPSAQDLEEAQARLLQVRPYVRLINSDLIGPLAGGEICVGVTYNGEAIQARKRAREAGNGTAIDFTVPDEGSLLWADLLAIPRDAPHPKNAHRLIDYLMDPHVAALNTNLVGYANANLAAGQFVDPAILADPTVYFPAEVQKRLIAETEETPEQARAFTRIWQKFKTGQ
jgi:putrescine transport system substrate-binding protein